MKKKIEVQPGDLIKVPYRQGFHTYARVLVEGSFAFYDCSSTAERIDFEKIIQSEILFTALVDSFALKEGCWTIIANIPLEENLINFYPRYFNPAPMNGENVIFYNFNKTEIEDAIKKDWVKTGKIQLDGIHGKNHIESRINDFYDGRRNVFNNRSIDFFKNYLGLPLNN